MPLNRFGKHYLQGSGGGGGGGGGGSMSGSSGATVRHYHFSATDGPPFVAATDDKNKKSAGDAGGETDHHPPPHPPPPTRTMFDAMDVFETMFANRDMLHETSDVHNLFEMSKRLRALLNDVQVLRDKLDVSGKRVANVGDPVEPRDAVTLAYLDSRYRRKGHLSGALASRNAPAPSTPTSSSGLLGSDSGLASPASQAAAHQQQQRANGPPAGGKQPPTDEARPSRVQNVADPINPNDAVNLKFFLSQLQALIDELDHRTLYITTAGTYGADNKKISQLANPEKDDEAVNLGFLRQFVSQFVTRDTSPHTPITTTTPAPKRKKGQSAAYTTS